MDTNASGASKAGVPHEKIVAVFNFQNSDLFTPAEKAALEVIDPFDRLAAVDLAPNGGEP